MIEIHTKYFSFLQFAIAKLNKILLKLRKKINKNDDFSL